MLYYELSGNGKEELVLLHGFMENTTIWTDMEERLSDDFRLIKIDLPGHGSSPIYSEVHTMEFMAEKVKEVTDHLNLKKFHLLGHSMGGYVSLAFAGIFPEVLKSITLFFSSPMADDAEKKEQRLKSLRVIREAFAGYVNAGVPNLFNPNEKAFLEVKIAVAKEIALSTPNEGAAAAVQGMAERTEKWDIIHSFRERILVIAGKHDTAVKTEEVLEQLPDRTNLKSYLVDCGHNGHWEKPAVCAEIINTELLHQLPKKLIF